MSCVFSSVCAQMNEPISPLPLNVSVDKQKSALGKKLFFDKRLSADGSISCASCHDLSAGYGADLKAVSLGVKDQAGSRNSPTVFNSAFNFNQFWDGRAADLKTQVPFPITDIKEMGMDSLDDVAEVLNADTSYVNEFKALFGSKAKADNIAEAIAEFQKGLVTVNTPFDQYLRGDSNAITAEQKRGYELFKTYGCISCHQGQNVGGNMFQKLGVLKNINLQNGSLGKDLGRYNVTRNEWDKRVFKVPSLRLAAVTPPYFHDGSVATLKEAIGVMIDFQLGREVPEQDIYAIVEFLKSLVGEVPKGVVQK